MNKIERIKMVKAMEFIMRNLNDEEELLIWMEQGVADGDVQYGDLDVQLDDGLDLAYWIDSNVHFADLMDTFLYVIRRACRNGRRGALVCDNVLSASGVISNGTN